MEKCMKCGEVSNDRRTLWMDCMYDMNELKVPFKQVCCLSPRTSDPNSKTNGRTFFTLRVCKDCRASWMEAIEKWFNEPIEKKSCGSGIYIRKNGTSVEVTEEEFRKIEEGRSERSVKT